MNETNETNETNQIDALLAEMIAHQWQRVRRAADAINPRLTDDDLAQPHDFPELIGSADWCYEDGILAGLRSAQAALRAHFRKKQV